MKKKIGYGDIVPYSLEAKVFSIVCIIFSCIVFGYSLNKIGEIFAVNDD